MATHHIFEGAAIPAKILSGPGSRLAMRDVIDSMGLNRLLLVTGPNVQTGSGVVEEITTHLGGRLTGIFNRTESHTPEASIREAVDCARKSQPDAVLSVGGGSVHDAAKAIAVLLPSGHSITELTTRLEETNIVYPSVSDFVPLRVITVPTTFSAAEVVGGGAFTAASNQEKRIFGHPRLTPTLVVLDGEVAATTPRPILLESGMNAVHHCIESLYSKGSQRITDAFALHALRGLLYSLPRIGPEAIEPDILDFQTALESASVTVGPK